MNFFVLVEHSSIGHHGIYYYKIGDAVRISLDKSVFQRGK